VGDLVGNERGEFGFVVEIRDEAFVDIEEAAGQGEDSAIERVDDLHGEGDFGIGMARKVLGETGHITGDFRVRDEGRATIDDGGHGSAHIALSFERVDVGAVGDVALADAIDVVLGGFRRFDVGDGWRGRCFVRGNRVRRVVGGPSRMQAGKERAGQNQQARGGDGERCFTYV
jgi:hypothetical protein